MATFLTILFFVWVFGLLNDNSCDCCHDVDHLQDHLDELDDDVTSVEEDIEEIIRRISIIEEHYGLQGPDERK